MAVSSTNESTRAPWYRHRLVVVAVAFVAIGLATRVGLAPPRAYGVLFVAVYAWVGLHQPPRTSLRLIPLFAVAYVVPLIGADPPMSYRALAIVGVTCVFVAETIAAGHRQAVVARQEALQLARAFRIVAGASASLQQLEPDAVLDAVVDGVMALGYDGANLVVIDEVAGTFVLQHPRGLAAELPTEPQPLGAGMTAIVQATREPLVVEDYASWEHAIEFYRHSGVSSIIGVPVCCNGDLIGVLAASTRVPRPVPASEVEPLQALADVAGAALANVERYEDQRDAAREHERAALTDALTGLPNRRHADEVLSSIVPGSSVVMIDVDHFRSVNERLGHAGGDRVLQALARHLSDGLRSDDYLARFGGEELVLVLPRRDLDRAVRVVSRLAESWRRTFPEATFSAGVAQHRGGEVRTTLARADAALYEAKRAGRDRCISEASLQSTSG